jgi:hypothetical protein
MVARHVLRQKWQYALTACVILTRQLDRPAALTHQFCCCRSKLPCCRGALLDAELSAEVSRADGSAPSGVAIRANHAGAVDGNRQSRAPLLSPRVSSADRAVHRSFVVGSNAIWHDYVEGGSWGAIDRYRTDIELSRVDALDSCFPSCQSGQDLMLPVLTHRSPTSTRSGMIEDGHVDPRLGD